MDREIKRGDIYLTAFDPAHGCEQKGTRPCLIVQNDIGNRYSPTVIVAAITSREKKRSLPIHYALPNTDLLTEKSMVMLEQIRPIDKSRLLEYLGSLDEVVMEKINRTLALSVWLYKPEERKVENDRGP